MRDAHFAASVSNLENKQPVLLPYTLLSRKLMGSPEGKTLYLSPCYFDPYLKTTNFRAQCINQHTPVRGGENKVTGACSSSKASYLTAEGIINVNLYSLVLTTSKLETVTGDHEFTVPL